MGTYPRWSLTSIYPDFSSDLFIDNVNLLSRTCESVRILAEESVRLNDGLELWLEDLISHMNMMLELYENLESYAYCRFSVNTRDREAVEGLNRIEKMALAVKSAEAAASKACSMHRERLLQICSEVQKFAPYRFILEEILEQSTHMMSLEMEDLAADLQRSGGDAWGRLQESVSSTSKTLWNRDTGSKKSVIELRALAFHPDRAVRQRAFKKELKVWESHEIPLAAALNGVKGFTVALDQRRSYASSLDHALAQARTSRKTLESLISVMEDALPDFRRYLKKKAQLLGLGTLAFYDLFAPLGISKSKSWSFEETKEFIIEQFSSFYPPMGDFARKAFEASWIDAQPDDGKVGGAYCIHFPLNRESRILCNFDGSFNSVTTVAHELGHAFHGHVLDGTPGLLRQYPMTLAETASIFAEAVVFNGAVSKADESERLVLIESYLKDTTQTIVDILSRFYFEKSVFETRQEHELAAEELCQLMTDAQKRTYGDGLEESTLHRYMWAVKGHYYAPDLAFYNYPYAFGQLLGTGLYQQYSEEGPEFCDSYLTLLRDAGSNSAEAVTSAAGFEITEKTFWEQGITQIRRYIDEFCMLADKQLG